MQQQRSQEDSCIHKRLIANFINLGPCPETRTLHNSQLYVYKQVRSDNKMNNTLSWMH